MSRTNMNEVDVLVGTRVDSFTGSPPVTSPANVRKIRTVRVSGTTPGYGKHRKGSHRVPYLPMNGFSHSSERQNYGTGEWFYSDFHTPSPNVTSHVGSMNGLLGIGSGLTFIGPSSSEFDTMVSRAHRNVLSKLKNSPVNIAQVYAERALTADLIASSAVRIAKTIVSLKKGDIRAAASALGAHVSRRKATAFNAGYKLRHTRDGAIANGWLELQYGWRPLLQDIYGSAELLAKKQSHEIQNKVTSKVTRNGNDSQTQSLGNPFDFAMKTYWQSYHADYQVVVYFSTTNPELATAKEMGLLNPQYLAWELLPFSFVVDWFLPVGNWLSNMDSTVGLTFSKGSETYFLESKSKEVWFANSKEYNGSPYGHSLHTMHISASAFKVSTNRSTLGGWPANEIPYFKNPLSFEHAANAIALLKQLF